MIAFDSSWPVCFQLSRLDFILSEFSCVTESLIECFSPEQVCDFGASRWLMRTHLRIEEDNSDVKEILVQITCFLAHVLPSLTLRNTNRARMPI